jgi:hypothetical protein
VVKKRCRSYYTLHISIFIWALINIAVYDAMISRSFVVPAEGFFWGRIRRLHAILWRLQNMNHLFVQHPTLDRTLLPSNYSRLNSINSSIKMETSVEKWCNDSDRGKPRYWERSMGQGNFTHRKSHKGYAGTEPVPPQ